MVGTPASKVAIVAVLVLVGSPFAGVFPGGTGSSAATVTLDTSWRQDGTAFEFETGEGDSQHNVTVIVEDNDDGTLALDWVIDHDENGSVYQRGVWDEDSRESVEVAGVYTHFWVNASDVVSGEVKLMDDTFVLEETTTSAFIFTDGFRTFEYDRDTGVLVAGYTDLVAGVLNRVDKRQEPLPETEPRTNESITFVDETNWTTNESDDGGGGGLIALSADQTIRVWCTVQVAENTMGKDDSCSAPYEMTDSGSITHEENRIDWPEFSNGELHLEWLDPDGQSYFVYDCNPDGLVYSTVVLLEEGCSDDNPDTNFPDQGDHEMTVDGLYGDDDDVCLNAESLFTCEIRVEAELTGPLGCGSADNDHCEVVS